MQKALKTFDTLIDKACIGLLVVSLLSMLFFSVLAIVLRWFNTSIEWTEPLVRHLVFLGTFLGGVLATGRGTHIGIDVATKFLEAKNFTLLVKNLSRIIYISSFMTLVWLAYASLEFIKVEKEFGREVFWGIHSGDLVKIIPVGFSFIALRYLLLLLLSLFPKEEAAH